MCLIVSFLITLYIPVQASDNNTSQIVINKTDECYDGLLNENINEIFPQYNIIFEGVLSNQSNKKIYHLFLYKTMKKK